MPNAEFIRFREMLRKNSHFITQPRIRLFATLQKHPALTLKELIAKTPAHDQVTVYRNIELFEKLGIVSRIRLGWHTKVELSDIFQHHHHHFTCLKCGSVIDLPEDSQIEKRILQLAIDASFRATDHQLEIRGYCKSCSTNLA